MGDRGVRRCVRSQVWVARRYAKTSVGLCWNVEVVKRDAWGAVRCMLEQVGSSRGACPEVGEIHFKGWVP